MELQAASQITEFDRTLAIFDEGQVVATAGIFSFEMTVPGGAAVPTGGVTRVSVRSTHRRRGLLTAMMRGQLEDIHARGEPLAALFASEAPIYGRYGYGIGTYDLEGEIERARAGFAQPSEDSGRISLVEREPAAQLLNRVWEKVRPRQPGMLSHTKAWWRYLLTDLETWRRGQSEQFRAVFEVDGEPEGYALYRLKLDWKYNLPDGTLTLDSLVASSPRAYAALWRHCLGVDLMARVRAEMRPVDEPLRLLLRDARGVRTSLYDALWIRLVDARAALAARRYATSGTLVLELKDALCPWNQGRFRIESTIEGATCAPTTARADLALDISDLAAAYMGANRFQTLLQAGRIDELTPRAASRADALFSSDRVAWCPTHF